MLHFLKEIFSVIKKAFIVVCVFATVITLFIYFINKDKPKASIDPILENRKEIYKTLNDPKIKSTEIGKRSILVYRAMMCSMLGEACTNKPGDGDINFNNSILGTAAKAISFPFVHPPASFTMWAYNGLQSAGFVPKSMAAEGIGFASIKPFMNLWKIFRDVAYMLLVIVLIAIGFMIMFRMKLNQQTVISVENALPKIVITMILITFSFAIAGFLIDLMYILIIIIIFILSGNNQFFNAADFQNKYLNANFATIWDSLIPAKGSTFLISGGDFMIKMGSSLLNIFPTAVTQTLRTIVGGVFVFLFVKGIQAITNKIPETFAGWEFLTVSPGHLPSGILGVVLDGLLLVIGFILGFFLIPQIVIGLFIWFTVLLLLFKIFFLLISVYLKIFLLIIFSPILLLFEAIPGKKAFSWWFKSLLAEILTFPIVILLFVVGYIIVNTYATPTPQGNLWTPPFLYGIDPTAYSVFLGMGIIFSIPDLVKLSKELLGVKELPINFGLGTYFQGASAAGGGAMGLLGTFSSATLALPGLRRIISDKAGFLAPLLSQDYKPPPAGGQKGANVSPKDAKVDKGF